jgi:hypothetical protein
MEKRVIDKTYEWAAWWCANAKIDKESLSLLKQIVHISKEDMKYYNLAMFTHAMDFFKERVNLNKSIPEHFFISLLNDLSTKYLVTLGNLLSTKFMKPKRWLYATPSMRAWVPQELKNKVLNHSVNRWMIRLAPKLRRMIVENNNVSRIDGRTKTQNFALNCNVIHMLIWIFLQSMWF